MSGEKAPDVRPGDPFSMGRVLGSVPSLDRCGIRNGDNFDDKQPILRWKLGRVYHSSHALQRTGGKPNREQKLQVDAPRTKNLRDATLSKRAEACGLPRQLASTEASFSAEGLDPEA